MDMIGRQNGARLYIRVLYISEDDDGLIDLLMELYTLSNYVPLLGTHLQDLARAG